MKQASVASATAVGVMPLPANRSLTQYPIVAEHSEPRETPHTLSCPAISPSYSMTNG